MGQRNRKRKVKSKQHTARRRNESLFDSFRRLNQIFIPTNNHPTPNLTGAIEKFTFVKLSVISYRFFKMWEEADFHKDADKEKRLFDAFWDYNSMLRMRQCPGFERLHVLNSNIFNFDDKNEEALSHIKHMNRDYLILTHEAHEFLKDQVIPLTPTPTPTPPQPHLFGIFFWDSRRLHEIEAKPLNIISLSYNKNQNLTMRKLRLIYFEDPHCFPMNAKIGPAASALCYLLQQYYLNNKQLKKMQKEKGAAKRGILINTLIKDELEMFYINKKYSVDSIIKVLKQKAVILGRFLELGDELEELEPLVDEFAEDDIVLIQPVGVEFSASSRSRIEFGLTRQDINTACSSCGKFVQWWTDSDYNTPSNTNQNPTNPAQSDSLTNHLTTQSGVIVHCTDTEWLHTQSLPASEAVLQCDCGMTHYCSLECKYFHKFRHNRLFDCKPKNFYFDSMFRIWQISKHPQNNFQHISTTIESFFENFFDALKQKKDKKKVNSKNKKKNKNENTEIQEIKQNPTLLEIFMNEIQGKTAFPDKNDIRNTIAHSIKTQNRFDTKMGLANIGNTCYMNAILQMIFSTGECLFEKFFKNPHVFLQTLDNHKAAPLSMSVILCVFELLFAGFDFGRNEELQAHLRCYLSPNVISFLENMLSSYKISSTRSHDGPTDSKDDKNRLQAGSSSKPKKLPSLAERRRLTPNFVNPVMIKYFIGIKREEFREFKQADGHELFVTFLDLLDNEKTEISQVLENGFMLKLNNQFTCTTCGFKKFKPESLNHISVSFENAVRMELENDFEVFLGDHSGLQGYSKARVRSEFSSFGVTGFKEYLVDALNPQNDEEAEKEKETKKEKQPTGNTHPNLMNIHGFGH